ncbi:MAG: NUDIX hydrolase [Ignavibacteriae bacterium]|nr:NUDIX hydrolase [Ignavibacteriota bacterium]
MNFCSNCGKPVHLLIPAGDHKQRFVCSACNTVHYENPRMIVGCLPRWRDKVLLCKRANEPISGFWTLPAGFLENDETAEAGAMRETREEANADVELVRMISLYSIPIIGQVYVFFLADLKNLNFHPGVETEITALFGRDEIPWDQLAFSSVRYTLQKYFANEGDSSAPVFVGSYVPNSESTEEKNWAKG